MRTRFQGCCVDGKSGPWKIDDIGCGRHEGGVNWASPCMVPMSFSHLLSLGPVPLSLLPSASLSARHPISPSPSRLSSRISHLPIPNLPSLGRETPSDLQYSSAAPFCSLHVSHFPAQSATLAVVHERTVHGSVVCALLVLGFWVR